MQAIVKERRAPGLKVATVPKPSPGPGEVLIAVRHAGVCGTDVHIADWDAWAEGRIKPPLVVGHEFAGEIVAAGDGVSELRPGQLVTAEGHIVCGHCLQCRTGNSHICKNTRIIGVDRDGAFAEYIAMPATNVLPLDGVPTTVGAIMDPIALDKFNLSISQIASAINANNQNAGGALLDNNQQSMVIRGVGLVQSTEDIENIVATEVKGVPVFIRDLGRVTIGAAPQTGIFGLNSKTGGVEGIVLMRRGENPSEVLKGIHDAVEDLNDSRLPKGVRISPIYDRKDLVGNTLTTVSHTLLEGLVIVIAMLFLFLGSVRAALLTAVTIPLSLLFAFVCMHFTGIAANLLSLGALDFGIIVDGTLVMVEHILHHVVDTRKGSLSAP